jgi:ATP-dependent RNA helicase DeaD
MTTPEVTAPTFADLNLHPKVLQGVISAGFETPSDIQIKAIPLVLDGRDLIAQAQTGTGKTAAFGLPSISRILNEATLSPETQILVITPTRELAIQVSDELYRLGRHTGIRSIAVYGGQSIGRQVEIINRGCQIVVATPGRLLDHLNSQRLNNFAPRIVILDEADEMLDMGFLDDIHEIFRYMPKNRQTLMFSATMPPLIKKLAEEILNSPALVHIAPSQKTNQDIEQRFYIIEDYERQDALTRLIDSETIEKAIVFCSTIRDTDELSLALSARGYRAHALHGNMEQSKRQEAIRYLQSGKINILVATDVAARGLDISGISHVFNYHIPYDPESYVHRIGRTGRAGNKGISATLVTPPEFKKLSFIQNHTKAPLTILHIPSREEVQSRLEVELLETIKREAYDPVENIDDYLAALTRLGMDWEDISRGLVQIVIKKYHIAGPEFIGATGKKLERFIETIQQPGKQRRTSGYEGESRGGGYGRSQYGNRRRDDSGAGAGASSYRKDRGNFYDRNSGDNKDRRGFNNRFNDAPAPAATSEAGAPYASRSGGAPKPPRSDFKRDSRPPRPAGSRW